MAYDSELAEAVSEITDLRHRRDELEFELASALQRAEAAELGLFAMEMLARRRALLHQGEGYWFELAGRPATVEWFPTVPTAAVETCRKLGLLDAASTVKP